MQYAEVLQQQIWATPTSLLAFLRENFFLRRAPVIQSPDCRGSCAYRCFEAFTMPQTTLHCLFSHRLCLTLNWSLGDSACSASHTLLLGSVLTFIHNTLRGSTVKGKELGSMQTLLCFTFMGFLPIRLSKSCISQWLWSVKCLETHRGLWRSKNFIEELAQFNSTLGFTFLTCMNGHL